MGLVHVFSLFMALIWQVQPVFAVNHMQIWHEAEQHVNSELAAMQPVIEAQMKEEAIQVLKSEKQAAAEAQRLKDDHVKVSMELARAQVALKKTGGVSGAFRRIKGLLTNSPQYQEVKRLEEAVDQVHRQLEDAEMVYERATQEKTRVRTLHAAGRPANVTVPVLGTSQSGLALGAIDPKMRFAALEAEEARLMEELEPLDPANKIDLPRYNAIHKRELQILAEKETLALDIIRRLSAAAQSATAGAQVAVGGSGVGVGGSDGGEVVYMPSAAGCVPSPPLPPLDQSAFHSVADAHKAAQVLEDQDEWAPKKFEDWEASSWAELASEVDPSLFFKAFQEDYPRSKKWLFSINAKGKKGGEALKTQFLQNPRAGLAQLGPRMMALLVGGLGAHPEVTEDDLVTVLAGLTQKPEPTPPLKKLPPEKLGAKLLEAAGHEPLFLRRMVSALFMGTRPDAVSVFRGFFDDPRMADLCKRSYQELQNGNEMKDSQIRAALKGIDLRDRFFLAEGILPGQVDRPFMPEVAKELAKMVLSDSKLAQFSQYWGEVRDGIWTLAFDPEDATLIHGAFKIPEIEEFCRTHPGSFLGVYNALEKKESQPLLEELKKLSTKDRNTLLEQLKKHAPSFYYEIQMIMTGVHLVQLPGTKLGEFFLKQFTRDIQKWPMVLRLGGVKDIDPSHVFTAEEITAMLKVVPAYQLGRMFSVEGFQFY